MNGRRVSVQWLPVTALVEQLFQETGEQKH